MKRILLVLTAAGAWLLVSAPMANAHGGHGSCAEFGVHVSTDAKVLHPQGQVVRQFAVFINEHVLADHATLCSSRP